MEIKAIYKDEQNYPSCFDILSKKPLTLYYMGDISLLEKKCIAIIGSREASLESFKTATDYGYCLAKQALPKENIQIFV